nr:SDR family oxidoreductase [Curvibacter sp. CHRR-16]
MVGRKALVTGGATGIGAAVAQALADAGARVAITRHSSAVKLPMQHSDSVHPVLPIGCDLAATRDMAPLLDTVEAGLGGALDILVNCAGTIRRADAITYTERDWSDVIAINLDALWRLSQATGARMVHRGSGKIINIASLLSFQGGIRVPAYTASKHAVAGLTKALANEWAAHGVNVNAIAPGYVETANTEALRADEQRSAQILARIPAGRWAQPEDIAGAAVFLSSRAADYVHGHVLVVDGGWLAR